jgi:hypothetical protein
VKSEYEFEDGLKLSSNLDADLIINMNNIKDGKALLGVDSKNDLKEFFYNNAFLVSEMVTRKLWKETTPVVYLESNLSETDLAKIYFNRAMVGYSLKDNLEIKDTSVLGIAAVDMYKLTKNEEYLNFSKYLFKLEPKFGGNYSYSLVYKIWLAQELTIITKDESYNLDVDKMASNMVFYNKKSEYQKGAFSGQSNAYYMTENCLIAGLFSTL